MKELIDFIIKTNTFNFAIILICIALICHYIKLGDKLEALKNEIIKKINDAKLEKNSANEKLSTIKKSVENLDEEINLQISNAKKSAQTMSENILNETKQQVADIQMNSEQIIQAEEKTLSTKILNNSADLALQLASEYLKSELAHNNELQKRFINESIEEIDRISL